VREVTQPLTQRPEVHVVDSKRLELVAHDGRENNGEC